MGLTVGGSHIFRDWPRWELGALSHLIAHPHAIVQALDQILSSLMCAGSRERSRTSFFLSPTTSGSRDDFVRGELRLKFGREIQFHGGFGYDNSKAAS